MNARSLGGAAAVLMLFLGAACGSDDDSDSAATTAATTATTAATGTTAAPVTTASKAVTDAAWKAIVDAANKEGQVTVYGTQSTAVVAALPAAFAKEYPNIKLNYSRISLAESQAKIEAELKSGLTTDVIEAASPVYIQQMSKDGHLVAPVGPAFSDPAYPHATTKINEAFAFQDAAYAWAWNTNRLPKGISSWNDFLTLKSGTLGVVDPSISAILTDEYKNIEKAAGAGFLDKLKAAGIKPQIYPGGNPAAAALAAGEIDAVLEVGAGQIATLKAKGSPVDFKVYDGAWLPRVWATVLKGAPHPNAAQVYANWAVSQGAQQMLADQFQTPVLKSVKSEMVPAGVTLNVSQPVTDAEVKAFLERWAKLFG